MVLLEADFNFMKNSTGKEQQNKLVMLCGNSLETETSHGNLPSRQQGITI